MYTLYTCTSGNDERQITGASREVPTGQSKQVEELQLANGSHNDPKQSTTEKEKCNEGIERYVTLKILSILSKKELKRHFNLQLKLRLLRIMLYLLIQSLLSIVCITDARR